MGFFADHSGDGEVPKHRLYYIALSTPLAAVAASSSSGSQTVTPSSMQGVIVGAILAVSNSDGTAAENVTVTAVTGSTFTATFANAHTVNWLFSVPAPVYWTDWDIDIETGGGDVCGAHRWTAQPITPGPVSNQPDGQSATFQFADADGVLFALLAPLNGGELAPAFIYEAGFLITNKTPVPDEVLEIFSGRVDRSALDTSIGDALEFVLMPPAQKVAGYLPTRLISTLLRS